MSRSLEAAAVSVRLRRLWLGEVLRSAEFRASDLADVGTDVTLRRHGNALLVGTPYHFGDGDPLGGELGELLRARVAAVSKGVVRAVSWEFVASPAAVRRARTSDLDVFDPGDPAMSEYPALLAALRSALPPTIPDPAREALARLRLVGVSRHRLWLAAPDEATRDALGSVPGARAALVTAVQALQKHEKPLYRVVVDRSYRSRRELI